MRIGIDVGGTNTDAVVMEGGRVVAKAKTPTTEDVTTGIRAAMREALGGPQLRPAGVDAVMIGTTHFVNAVLEGKHLTRTAALRLGAPATTALPPFVDWPAELVAVVDGGRHVLHGGREFDGRAISDLDEKEVVRVAERLADEGITAVAVSSVFAPVDESHEEAVRDLLRDRFPDLDVTLSSEIGRMGLLERENAGLLNAALRPLARRTVNALARAVADEGMDAALYLTQNDGTLMDASYAAEHPVLTFASGPTNSMRGAAFLSGMKDGIVVDIGGTSTDVGALKGGFPREAATSVRVGGVRTNFRMPDVLSIALGGGSLVAAGDPPWVGPESVGFRIRERALVFGGDDLTATDVAVAAGYATGIGDAGRVADLSRELVESTVGLVHSRVEETVDRMKVAAGEVPVVLVGGGSVLVDRPLAGASDVSRPDHHEAANAVGAAIAQISGDVDRVFNLSEIGRGDALDEAKREAVARAVEAGAIAETVEIVDVEDVPLAYLPSNATRVRVKAVGELGLDRAEGTA